MTPSQWKELHTETDGRIHLLRKKGRGPDGQKLRVTCREGCPSCCYEPVYVEKGEAKLALGAAEGLGERVFDVVKARISRTTKELQEAHVHEAPGVPVVMYRTLRIACPFLDIIHGRCFVYASRPYACRTHLAVGPKRLCDVDALRHTQKYAKAPQLSLLRALQKAGPSLQDIDHLIFHLARRLGVEIESAAQQAIEIKE